MEAFDSLALDYPLFTGESLGACAIEVYPHATAVILAGCLRPKNKKKIDWRRQIIGRYGVTDNRLRSTDLVDATLAALTGLYFLEGSYCYLGPPQEGVIILPCSEGELPERYKTPAAP